MACFRPRKVWPSRIVNDSGKRSIVFSARQALRGSDSFPIPCGWCVGCRRDKAREIAVRAVNEASLYKNNCFLTLTYNEENLPRNGDLCPEDVVLFLKRLREHRRREVFDLGFRSRESREGFDIRAYGCAEYGSRGRRPHYHLLVFNFDFLDKVVFRKNDQGDRIYVSDLLSELWPLGFSTIGDLTFSSAAYVAAYVTKKWHGKDWESKYTVVDGFSGLPVVLNREQAICVPRGKKGGLGKPFYDKFPGDIFPHDSVVISGREVKTPRYYDRLFERHHLVDFQAVKVQRQETAVKFASENTPDRLKVREKCFKDKIKVLKRGYEYED